MSKAIGHDPNSAAKVDVPIVGFKRPSYRSMIEWAATRKNGLCERSSGRISLKCPGF